MHQNITASQHFESLYPEDARFEEIKRILEWVKAGKSCQVIGFPGVGKSNLLRLLSYNRNVRFKHLGEAQKWFHFVYMDFSEVRKRSLFDSLKFILISTAYSLSERGLSTEYETVQKFMKEAISYQDELILFQALKKSIDYLAIEKELTIVFLFDRFEEYIHDVNEKFFLDLKLLRSRAKYRFSTLFALTRPMEDVLDSSIFSEFYEFFGGNTVFLHVFDQPGITFRFSYLEKITGRSVPDDLKKKLVHLTGGHGKLSRLAYEAVLSEEKKKIENLKSFLLSKSVIERELFIIWNFLTPSEKTILKALAQKVPLAQPTAPYLEQVGIIDKKTIAIPLLEAYIKELKTEKGATIRYDAIRNEIVKGETDITDMFSPSEFRLLRFLLKNQGRICEKEEIISSVWKDSKTQEGVTDQALDQIIYRLRRKIEDNPNSPTHLQTIKGRGFRFIP